MLVAMIQQFLALGKNYYNEEPGYIRNSPARFRKFKEAADFVGIETKKSLCLDVPTHWNSTFLMLSTACLFEKAFEKYGEDESSFKTDLKQSVPDLTDWEMVRKFADCLSHFYSVTLRISGSLYVTANMHFQEICDLNVVLCDMIESEDSEGGSLYKYVVDELNVLSNEYVSLYECGGNNVHSLSSQSELAQPQGGNVLASVVPGSTSTRNRKPASVSNARFKQHRLEMGTASSRKSELEIYLSEDLVEDGDELEVLSWWKQNAQRFPILSKLAMDILGVPISTIASESAFSTVGRVLDCFRSSLTPKLVEALICTQDWLRAYKAPLVVEECLDELDSFKKELPNIGPPAT
ncbi:zinc finger BED domain-containing protein RICESLEEPER 2-like [Mercurialis annua]|uniref:zinc finger BED domain-containing protein RICESLEEPER 2-like n=1 Tax=Mercurialis annua TaxID=3986 RepID=UPI00215E9651|nr:zinc finger BED domain-containing protein RICESLEEPER 2-like [Mercurialis annua]